MDTVIYLVIGVALGGAVGWLVGSRGKGSGSLPDGQIELADAKARVDLLQKQVTQLETERNERQARYEKEDKLFRELAPVKDNLTKMQDAVAKMETERVAQVASLNEAIKQAVESDAALRRETQMLSKALSSNTMRGVWGEAQLRKLVELAGLVKHADFTEQSTNTTGRADMIITLPGGKSLAIDSKVPYNSYQEASQISELATGADGERRKELMKAHVKAVKKHIDDLAGKAYWSGLSASPDFVSCFIPSESLLSAALSEDPTLLEYAFGKNVAIASPVSLFSVLKTINFIWRQNVDETQVRSMIKLGRELYERVGKVAELADKLGRSIMGTVKDYNAFVKSLESRMIVTARKLNNLDENELAVETIESPLELEPGLTLPSLSEMGDVEEAPSETDENK